MSDDELNDPDMDELERQIAAMDGGDDDHKQSNKAAKSKLVDDEHIDVDKLLAEMSDGGDVGDDDDEMAQYDFAGLNKKKDAGKAEAPKQAPAKQAQAPAPEVKAVTKPPQKLPPKQVEEGQDANGVDEEVLMAEEDVYHVKEDIFSVTCLADEIENYITPIIDGKLVGENYRDVLDTQRDEWQLYVDQLSSKIQAGKITLDKYLEFILLGQKSQTDLLAKAKAKKASKTTVDRITHRLKLLAGEIAEVKEQLGQTGGTPMDIEKPAPVEEQKKEPKPKNQEAMEPEVPKKPKFKVSEDKLEQLSKKLNQYKYFLLYCHENQIGDNNGLMAKVKDIKDLFKNPPAITPEQYQGALQVLSPSITIEMILGMTPDERATKIETALDEANHSFELMKEVGCSKEEALSTVDTIKYLKKIKETPTARFPKIRIDELIKQAPNKTNAQIPDDCIRLTILKLSGTAGHRTVYIKYSFEYGGARSEGESPYVNSCYSA